MLFIYLQTVHALGRRGLYVQQRVGGVGVLAASQSALDVSHGEIACVRSHVHAFRIGQ